MKIRIPVTQLDVIFRDLEDKDIDEVLLDFERQLNNLKLVSDVRPIGIYPRFHLGGDYEILCASDTALKGRTLDTLDKQERIRVSSGQCQGSGVQKDASLQPGSSPRVSEEVRIAYIKKMIGHYESGLLIGREVLEAITVTLEAPLARVKVALEKEEK